MLAYSLKKLLQLVITTIGVVTLVFFRDATDPRRCSFRHGRGTPYRGPRLNICATRWA